MKKILIAFLPWLFIAFGYKAMAQDDMNDRKKDRERKESEEIVIRKKGDRDVNINVQINGDKISINGKPLSEYKDDGITINRRKTIVRDAGRDVFAFGGDDFGNGNMQWNNDDSEAGAFLGVTTEKTDEGAKITEEVSKESAAGKAGLQKGDIIIKLDDKKIDGPQSLYKEVSAKKPKDEVQIMFKRDGKEKTVKAILGERKGSFSKTFSYSGPDGSYKTFTMPYVFNDDKMKLETDLQLKEIEKLRDLPGNFNGYDYGYPRRQKLGLKIQDTEEENGVKVLEVQDSSAAAAAGLKKEDIITEIGGEKVKNTDEAREQLQENNEKGSYIVKARRNGSEMNFTIKIPKKLKTTNL